MKVEITKELKIKLKDENIKNFKLAIDKILEENKKIGFKSSILNENEIKVLNNIKELIVKKQG
jgi:hypothetical protein